MMNLRSYENPEGSDVDAVDHGVKVAARYRSVGGLGFGNLRRRWRNSERELIAAANAWPSSITFVSSARRPSWTIRSSSWRESATRS